MSAEVGVQIVAPQPVKSYSQSLLLQRKCSCGGTAGLTSECTECQSKRLLGKPLQTKLRVNEPGDEYEQEADRVADQVMAASAHHVASDAPPRIQRFSGQSNGSMDAAPASVDHALASAGRPLEPTLRQDMEQRFGHDFSRVRVHSGANAEQSAREVSANAYTVGHDMVFGTGRFTPGTHEGRRLIAHELTHVVQQSVASRPLLLRNGHSRAPVLEPGTGFDGIRQPYGEVFDRSLTAEQVNAVKDFRAWMEAGFTSASGYAKGNWAREAAARTAAFLGNAQARASLYAEFQRQIVQATGGAGSDWYVSVERGADSSYIFRGNPAKEAQRVFVVEPTGNCYAGQAEAGLQGRGQGKTVHYSKLRAVGVGIKTATGGAATAPEVMPGTPAPMTPPASTVSEEISVPTTRRLGSTLGRGVNVVAGALGVFSMAAEYYGTGYINFGVHAERTIDVHGETHLESDIIRLGEHGFEKVIVTPKVERFPRGDMKTLTPAEAERTLNEGDYFIKKSSLSGAEVWQKIMWEEPDELWEIVSHRAVPTGCTGYDNVFRCPPIELPPIIEV